MNNKKNKIISRIEKRIRITRFLALIGILAMMVNFGTGCSSKNTETNGTDGITAETQNDTAAVGEKEENTVTDNQTEDINDSLTVYTSFYPMYDFAAKIGGDKITVVNLVPAGMEPHDWEPSTTDIKNLENADLLIYNGAGMEHWIDQVVTSLENKELITVEASKGLTLTDGFEDEDGDVGTDPHVWLSIRNAKVEMENIKNALQKADPVNRDYYEQNYTEYAAEFDDLDTEYQNALKDTVKKDIVVSHQAFGYLCGDYGLNQVPIEGLSADSEPDAARMAEIIDFVKANDVSTIFFEELVSPKVAKVIASETGASAVMLNPLEGLSDEEISAGDDYITVMENNLQALTKALQ